MSIKTAFDIENISGTDITGAIISSVVPSATASIKTAVKRLTGADALVVGPGLKTGLSIKIDNPAQLGSDLVVNAVAGIAEYGAPLVVFDLGTATTASVINAKKEYIGGIIMPGVMISLNAMVQGTSQLPQISFEPPKKLIGANTVDCMKSGILYGSAASIDGMIDRIRETEGNAAVVATGGLAKSIIPFCKNKIILDDELLIKGLMIIYNKNKTG